MSEAGGREDREPRWEILCWLFALLALLYAFALHHGIGPRPPTTSLAWYEPRGFLQSWQALAWAFEPP